MHAVLQNALTYITCIGDLHCQLFSVALHYINPTYLQCTCALCTTVHCGVLQQMYVGGVVSTSFSVLGQAASLLHCEHTGHRHNSETVIFFKAFTDLPLHLIQSENDFHSLTKGRAVSFNDAHASRVTSQGRRANDVEVEITVVVTSSTVFSIFQEDPTGMVYTLVILVQAEPNVTMYKIYLEFLFKIKNRKTLARL